MKTKVGSREPIAIIGMSCRFPHVNSLQDFWKLLSQGKDTITEIPSERWDIGDYYDPDPSAVNKTNQRHGSMMKNIHDFDPLFFAISPAEAAEMNPSQKLMLELVWEAIENSTIPYKKVQGRKASVYVGNIWSDFEHLRKHKNAPVTSHSAVGQSSNIIANRVSFSYGFTGPSLVVDTGCSSSLVALHLACQSLWDNSTEMSFVGGINHILDPDQYILLSKFGGLSSKGKCSTFDIDADGFVRGEGAGVLMLKKLSDAEKDGDKIYALIRGTAINNNGYNVNLPATSVGGQKQVLTDAYADSGIEPHEVHYLEAHGTGTKLGDPTETRALGEFFRERRNGKLHIGSVKTNLGHLEAAAGIAGLIKVALAMQHKALPPSLNFKTPNPNIPFEELKLNVQHQIGPWPVQNGETLKAGINSFGWGGTNAHTVLEEYRKIDSHDNETRVEVSRYCLPISAKSAAALKAYVKEYIDTIEAADEDAFKKICVSSAILKPSFDHRTLFSAASKSEMIQAMNDFLESTEDIVPHQPLTSKDRLVMVFPGQGSQWLGMGRELFIKEAVFRDAIEACDKAFAPYTDWSLIDQLHSTNEESRLNEINVIQPALCAMQIALAKLWMSWGVKPDAVVGHSMGEVAAAYISGALNLDDAARVICTRSRLMRTVSGKGGAMAVTELSLTDAEAVVERYPELSVAVNNSPKSTVLAGNQQAIDKVLAELESKNLFCRQVKVDVASHSQQMDPLKDELYETLKGIAPVEPAIPIYSTVKSKQMKGGEDRLNAAYWVSNLRGTVQFASVVKQLTEEGHVVFIEVSPHPVLVNAINECAEHYKAPVISAASTYREKPEQESIYKNLGDLFTRGYEMPWEDFYKTTKAADITLPSYPFQRERYEIEDRSGELEIKKSNSKFPLLGNPILLAGADDTYFWETQLSLGSFPYMRDHQVNETPVLPGAAYVEMILEAAGEIYDRGNPVITHLRFIRSINLSAEEVSSVQLKISKQDEVSVFQFFMKDTETPGRIKWELLAEGELRIRPKQLLEDPVEILEETSAKTVDSAVYYESLKSLGLDYGSHFRGLSELKKSEYTPDELQFSLTISDLVRKSAGKYKIHPALLDACFQPLFYFAVEDDAKQQGRTTFLTDVGEIHSMGPLDPEKELKGVARLYPLKKDEQRGFINVEADIMVYHTDGSAVFRVRNLKGKIIDTSLMEQRKEKLKNWLYKVSWVKLEEAAESRQKVVKGTWVVMGDPYGVSEILVEKMRGQHMECIHVTPGTAFSKINGNHYSINYGSEDDYSNLMKGVFTEDRRIAGIIHAASMSYTWQDPYLTADIVERHQVFGSISFMYLHQQLTAMKLAEIPQLVIVTNGIHIVGHEQDIAQPVHSPLWGMVKVMFNELTQYNSRYFDMSANPSVEEIEQIVAEIQLERTVENEIALRGNVQYVPRLGVHMEDEVHTPHNKRFSSTGTYLVTGFRGLGFVFIEWMIRQGARQFALVSRSGKASPEVMERISVLESQGCQFKIYPCDTGNYQELKAVLDDIELTMSPLRGVVHAAGVIEARTLTDLDQHEFLQILNPKVKGAWNLHLLTQHLDLDCFIMFSSASTLIGLSGQGSYVAANAFLDTLAHSRRRMGLPGMSVNWGVMRDVGMVANEAELEKYARAEGFEPVSMHDAMEVFNTIYDNQHTQIGIVKLHAESMANYYSALARTRYFKGLLAKETKDNQKSGNFLQELMSLTSGEERVAALEQLVIQHVSKIIKTPASRIKSTMTFKGLGIDSLMAIQLRNLLEKSVDLKLSVAMFWNHPSIQEYASFLSGALSERLLTTSIQAEQEAELKHADASKWFVIPKPNPTASFRLFCFHDAGGNSSLYHDWEKFLGQELEMVAVELPGRGRRLSETPHSDIESLIRDIKPALLPLLDKPFMFLGHSMGGLVAFELTRELRREGLTLPSKLFISSTPALTTYSRREVDHTLSDDELIDMFPHLRKENIGDDELQQLLLNLLRADLHLLNNYRFKKEESLNIPLIVVHGDSDPRVKNEQAEKWSEETTALCKVITRPGGHRYIEQDREYLTALIEDEVYATIGSGSNASEKETIEVTKD